MAAKPIIDRRRHRVYVTRNTEYHTRDNRCVAVRERATGLWLWGHKAMWTRVLGSIGFSNGGVRPTPGLPQVGDSLFLCGVEGDTLITSTLQAVDRPEPRVVGLYPAYVN